MPESALVGNRAGRNRHILVLLTNPDPKELIQDGHLPLPLGYKTHEFFGDLTY